MKNKQVNFRKCPLCGSSTVSMLKHLRYALFDDSPLSNSYDLVSCNRCGFVFFDTENKTIDLNNYYKENLHYMDDSYGTGSLSLYENDRYTSIISTLRDKMSKSSKIVDIGSGKGGFCSFLKTQGYMNLLAIDLLPSCVNFIRENKIYAETGSVEKLKLRTDSIDVIILSHILEHIVNLRDAIKELYRVIINKGIIYVETPSIEYGSSFKNAPMWDFIYEHINYFSMHHLISLFESHHFTCIESGRKEIHNGNGSIKCIYATFKKDINTPSKNVQYYDMNKKVLNILDSINNIDLSEIEKLIKEKTPCYVWGISEYMQLLVEMTPVKRCNIVSFLDKSKYKQTKTINTIPIKSPKSLEKESNNIAVIFPAEPYSNDMNQYLNEIKFSGKRIIV